MSDMLSRTMCYCIIIIGGLYYISYVANIEQRVTSLEARYENSFVLPVPMPFDIDLRPRGDNR